MYMMLIKKIGVTSKILNLDYRPYQSGLNWPTVERIDSTMDEHYTTLCVISKINLQNFQCDIWFDLFEEFKHSYNWNQVFYFSNYWHETTFVLIKLINILLDILFHLHIMLLCFCFFCSLFFLSYTILLLVRKIRQVSRPPLWNCSGNETKLWTIDQL